MEPGLLEAIASNISGVFSRLLDPKSKEFEILQSLILAKVASMESLSAKDLTKVLSNPENEHEKALNKVLADFVTKQLEAYNTKLTDLSKALDELKKALETPEKSDDFGALQKVIGILNQPVGGKKGK